MTELRCPYCYGLVKKVEGSKQFVHISHEDYFKCLRIPTYSIQREGKE